MAEKTSTGREQGADRLPDLESFRLSTGLVAEQGGGMGGRPSNPYLWLLGMEPVETAELVGRLDEGFSYEELEHLRENMGLSRGELAGLIRVPARTLDRRRREGRLQPEESDRLLRLARVFGAAVELFEGDAEVAGEWLFSSQRALGGMAPFDMAKSDVGAREVEGLIGRLEHGVFS